MEDLKELEGQIIDLLVNYSFPFAILFIFFFMSIKLIMDIMSHIEKYRSQESTLQDIIETFAALMLLFICFSVILFLLPLTNLMIVVLLAIFIFNSIFAFLINVISKYVKF